MPARTVSNALGPPLATSLKTGDIAAKVVNGGIEGAISSLSAMTKGSRRPNWPWPLRGIHAQAVPLDYGTLAVPASALKNRCCRRRLRLPLANVDLGRHYWTLFVYLLILIPSCRLQQIALRSVEVDGLAVASVIVGDVGR